MKNRDKEKGNMKERVRDMAVIKIRSKKMLSWSMETLKRMEYR